MNKKLKTVFLLIPELKTLGGFEGQVTLLACGLKAAGLNVFVISRDPIASDHPGYRMMIHAGVPVLFPSAWWNRLLTPQRRKRIAGPAIRLLDPLLIPASAVLSVMKSRSVRDSWRAARRRVRKIIEQDYRTALYFDLLDQTASKNPPDIVDVQHSCLPEALIWGHDRGWPLVYTEYGAPDEKCLPGVWKPLEGIINHARFIIIHSNAGLTGLRRVCGANRPAAFVPNAVIAAPSQDELNGLERNSFSEVTITAIGRLSPEKGLQFLMEAFQMLLKEGLPVRLIIAGDGPMGNTLKDRACEMNLNGAIQFTGAFETIQPIIKKTHIFAHPTLNDGRSVSVLEAMAWGKPVVASRTGGVEELIDDGISGLLIPPGDSNALASALKRLVLEPDTRQQMGKAAREKFLEGNYTQDAMTEAVLRIYSEVIAN